MDKQTGQPKFVGTDKNDNTVGLSGETISFILPLTVAALTVSQTGH
jgi:hypothetical protein